MTNETTPLPCPFCGKPPKTDLTHAGMCRLGCTNPACGINPWVFRATRRNAVKKWNRRKP